MLCYMTLKQLHYVMLTSVISIPTQLPIVEIVQNQYIQDYHIILKLKLFKMSPFSTT